MSQNRTTIEINGKQYDAQTGRLIGAPVSGSYAAPAMKSVDGFGPAPRSAHVQRAGQPAHRIHQAPRHTETLQRKYVKKPGAVNGQPSQAAQTGQPAIHHVTQTVERHPLTVSGSYMHQAQPAPDKEFRAQAVNRSRLVSKFGSQGNGIVKKVEPMHVKAAPPEAHAIERQHHSAPLEQRGTPQAFADRSASSLLDRGIERANAHDAAPHRKLSHRHRVARKMGIHPSLINIGAASLIGLLLIGFFVYQNTAKIAMRVASSKSGVAVTAPTTLPPGFTQDGPIRYGHDLVTLTYDARGDNKGFTLSEQNSEWTSSALFSNMFADGTIAYQTHQQNGLTVYTYGEGNATWVSGGIRYDITGDADLNNDQIMKIATSL